MEIPPLGEAPHAKIRNTPGGTKRLGLSAFGETSPSRKAICCFEESGPFDTVSSRQQTTLQPNPTDRKPTLEAERQGLGCSEPGTFRPSRPRRSRRQHSKFRTFFGNFKPFRRFFCDFFCRRAEFPPDDWVARRSGMRTARRFAGVQPSRRHRSPLTVLPTVCPSHAVGRFAPARPAQPERKHRRRRDAGSGPLSRAARRRRAAWKDIAVHEGRSSCHAMAVGRPGSLPKGEAHHAGTLYNGCAGAR